jgi:hypothetical protein
MGGVEAKLKASLTAELDGNEWSASPSSLITIEERGFGTIHWIRG